MGVSCRLMQEDAVLEEVEISWRPTGRSPGGTVKLSGILGFWSRNRSSVERRINNLGSGQGAD